MSESPAREATVKEVKDFFGEPSISKFTAEYKQLTEKDKTDLKTGIGNGTLNY